MGWLLVFSAMVTTVVLTANSLYDAGAFGEGANLTAAAALLDHHQAAIATIRTNSGLPAGEFSVARPVWLPDGPFVHCTNGVGGVVTYSTDGYPRPQLVARSLERLRYGTSGYGLSGGGMVFQKSGAKVALPCVVPNGLAVAVTKVF